MLYIEQGMDQSLVDFFHDITDEILHNSPYVEFKDIETVRKLFEVDSGRRLFAYFVSSSLNKVIFSRFSQIVLTFWHVEKRHGIVR